MKYTMLALALSVSLLIPFQGIITASLSQKLDNPYLSTVINFSKGLVIFLIALMLSMNSFPAVKKLSTIPWYLYLGGVVGSVFILNALFSLPKIGSMSFFALVILGQLITTLLVDHYEVFGVPIQRIDLTRVFRLLLLIGRTFLVIKK